MGRVDDAMRRAAEARGRTERTELSGDSPAADTLLHEPFPLEMPDRRRLRSVVPPPGSEPDHVDPAPARPRARSVLTLDRIDRSMERKLVIDRQMMPADREQYRRLGAKLHELQETSGLRVIMLTSAAPGEGKTLTASNLALTLSESYRRRVLLIDADLRRPSVHTVFQMPSTPGLTDALSRNDNRSLPVHDLSAYLSVVPAGKATSDPMADLTSDHMRQIVDDARQHFEWVIIDSPPVGLLADANLLASMADGVLLVVKADDTDYVTVQRAVETLHRERILGVILNQASRTSSDSIYAYHAYYHAQPDAN
jgi:protein-tyrosine kinase